MATYFWCTSGEDGTRIEPMTESDVQKRLDQLIDYGETVSFLPTVPPSDKGCWRAPENAVVIIKGTVVVPTAMETVTRWTF